MKKMSFFNRIRQIKQYQDDYDYNVIQYRHMQLLDEYEGVERTSKELRMINQVKFMQAQLPIFLNKLNKLDYYKAIKAFDKHYNSTEEQLKDLKNSVMEVVFLAAKSGSLSELQEKTLIATLANIDVDTTKKDLSNITLYDVKNEKKYVAVRPERLKKRLSNLRNARRTII